MTDLAEPDRLLLRNLLYIGLFDGALAVLSLLGANAFDDTLVSTWLTASGGVAAWCSGSSFAMHRALTQFLARTEEVVASVEPSQRPSLLARLNEGAVAYRELWQVVVPIACALLAGVFLLVSALV